MERKVPLSPACTAMPVAGPQPSADHVCVQNAPFDVGAEIAALHVGRPDVGAIATFVGTVRDLNVGQAVSTLTLEHYPGMTERSLWAIIARVRARFQILSARIVHRVGPLHPTDVIVMVAVSSAHRGQAFAACECIMDFLKTEAPFWKKETGHTGDRWVAERQSDVDAAARWSGGAEAGQPTAG